MRLSLLMLAVLAPALPAFAAEAPELQRAVGAPQAVGAVHTLRVDTPGLPVNLYWD
mgnify:CR=1 FL=1